MTKKFRGEDGKLMFNPLNNGEVYQYTIDDIIDGLNRLNLNKATSWDFIPGKVFTDFKEDRHAVVRLPQLLNELNNCKVMPPHIVTGRLLCLNKNRPEPGCIDAIRPITITGIISKLLEFPLLRELKKVRLSRSQLGFREGLSTEMNIMRLMHRMNLLKKEGYKGNNKMGERYILFVDLKQAFDSVNHEKLIIKLLKNEVSIYE